MDSAAGARPHLCGCEMHVLGTFVEFAVVLHWRSVGRLDNSGLGECRAIDRGTRAAVYMVAPIDTDDVGA